ncbi:MAG: hypothetical protein OJF51_005028 [Nitrospira sp.]|nr:MAG: hypothetical protein OJF51_005028 [Nitrospira sp.]
MCRERFYITPDNTGHQLSNCRVLKAHQINSVKRYGEPNLSFLLSGGTKELTCG